jgi:hypothetical protein
MLLHAAFLVLSFVMVPAIAGAQPTLREQALTHGVREQIVIVDYPNLPLRQLTSAAGVVLRVMIRGSQTSLTANGTSMVTDYWAAVIDVVKRPSDSRVNSRDTITIRRLGGVIDIEGFTVSSHENGFPPFETGKEYVLFLKVQPDQPFELVAGPQSAFRVDEGTIVPASADSQRSAIPMHQFVREVRQVASVDH